jgi:hypothetical protein
VTLSPNATLPLFADGLVERRDPSLDQGPHALGPATPAPAG